MNEQQFKEKIQQSKVFIAMPVFKQRLTLNPKNRAHLIDIYGQAKRLGLDYIKQNRKLSQTDVKLIESIL